MNNAKMWLVVKPSVGVPLFLAGVGIGSFCVHVAVTSYSNWFDDFVNGGDLNAAAASVIEEDTMKVPASYTLSNGVSADALLSH
jgi:light-harvesting protein B-800-850 alpha chain